MRYAIEDACNFTPRRIEMLNPPDDPPQYRCDSNMWSGSFYRLDAVQAIDLSDPNYVLDWGDVILGYEGVTCGYIGFVDQSSLVWHHLHPIDTVPIIRACIRRLRDGLAGRLDKRF